MIVRSARLASGLMLPYVEHGDPSGTPVVLLHGITDSWRSFERVLPHLPADVRAFAVTQRGHGDAERPADGYRTRDFADDVAGFLDAVGLKQAAVVGHSMGAANALRFTVDHPARVRRLVLAGAFADFRGKPDLIEYVEHAVKPLTDPIDPAFARDFQQSTLTQPIPADYFEAVVAESLKIPARVWHAAFTGLFADDLAPLLGRVTVPTLMIWGAHDAYCSRADQDRLLAGIRGARLVTYANAGHALHWEEPERFAADVAAFVRQ